MYVGKMLMVDTRPRQRNAIFASTFVRMAQKTFQSRKQLYKITFQVKSAPAC